MPLCAASQEWLPRSRRSRLLCVFSSICMLTAVHTGWDITLTSRIEGQVAGQAQDGVGGIGQGGGRPRRRGNDEVPLFYMYEDWSLDWSSTCDIAAVDHLTSKHGDDVFFWEMARGHRRRTLDPEKADLFVVPLMLSLAHRGWCGMTTAAALKKANRSRQDQVFPHSGFLAGQALQDAAADALERSPWYQRSQGADHIVIAGDYEHGLFHSGHLSVNSKLRHTLRYAIFGRFEQESLFQNGFAPGRCHVVVPYTIYKASKAGQKDLQSFMVKDMDNTTTIENELRRPRPLDALHISTHISDWHPVSERLLAGQAWQAWAHGLGSHSGGAGGATRLGGQPPLRPAPGTIHDKGEGNTRRNTDFATYVIGYTDGWKASPSMPCVVNNRTAALYDAASRAGDYAHFLAGDDDHVPKNVTSHRQLLRAIQMGPCYFEKPPYKSYLMLAASSNLMLHARGDTHSAGRLYDAVMLGSIPVVYGWRAWHWGLPFSAALNWTELAFFVTDSDLADPAGSGAARVGEIIAELREPAATTDNDAHDEKSWGRGKNRSAPYPHAALLPPRHPSESLVRMRRKLRKAACSLLWDPSLAPASCPPGMVVTAILQQVMADCHLKLHGKDLGSYEEYKPGSAWRRLPLLHALAEWIGRRIADVEVLWAKISS